MERSKRNKHVICNKVDDVVNVDDDSDDDCVDNGDDSADKHLTHFSQAADSCLMERSKCNKHVVYNKGNDVHNCVEDGENIGVDDGDYGADKDLTHLSQAADCCLLERIKHNKH
eukprot:11921657-Ditylum_brightwellii.AAC.1